MTRPFRWHGIAEGRGRCGGGIRTTHDRQLAIVYAVQQLTVGIDAPIAQELPALTRLFDFGEVAIGDQNRVALAAGAADDLAKGPGDEGMAPEFDFALTTDAIDRSDVNSIGDRMGAL